MTIKILGSGNIRSPEISASALINDLILIDCGHSVYKRLLQPDIDINKIQYVFITHLHSDHFIDLTALISYFNSLKPTNPNLPKPHIFLPKGGIEALDVITLHTLNQDIDPRTWLTYAATLEEYADDTPIDIDDYQITPILVDHGTMKPAYGFIIKTPSDTIGYSGDSKTCPGIDRIIEASDTLILDISNPTENIAHMGLDNLLDFSKKYSDKQFYATHLSTEVRQSAASLPPNAHLLQDSEIINY